METVTIMGVPFIHIDQQGFVQLLDKHITEKKKTFVITANPEIVMKANEDKEFMDLVRQAHYVTADGIGVVKAAKLLDKPLPGRVTGYDTMMQLMQVAHDKNYKIYLLGAKPETLEIAKDKLQTQFPGLQIVGSHHGYFDWDDNTIAEEAAALKPDIIFVALGVPRQEKWISQNMQKFDKGVFMGIGGSFDAVAGTMKRAPEIWQRLNIEWLYRLIKQPSRWRRMLALPRFALKIIKQKVKGSS